MTVAYLDIDVSDGDARELLAMAVELLIALTTLLVEHENLVALAMLNNSCLNGTLDVWCANSNLAVIACEKDVGELYSVANILVHERNLHGLLWGDRVLLTGDLYDCVHESLLALL